MIGMNGKEDVIFEEIVNCIEIWLMFVFSFIVWESGIIIVFIVILGVLFDKVVIFVFIFGSVVLKFGVLDGFFMVVGVFNKVYSVIFVNGDFLSCDSNCVNCFIKICEYML